MKEIMCLLHWFLYLSSPWSKCLSDRPGIAEVIQVWLILYGTWYLITVFNYVTKIVIFFTANRKNTAGWLVGNSTIQQTINLYMKHIQIRSKLNQGTRDRGIDVINSFIMPCIQQYETQGANQICCKVWVCFEM